MKVLFVILLSIFSEFVVAEAWQEKIGFSGDFRFRHEAKKDVPTNDKTNHRQRMRIRLRMDAEVNDKTQVVFRLVSGGKGITSANQTLDTSATNKEINFDLAFVEFIPRPNYEVLAGKMNSPYYSPGDNQLLWDADYTPEGISFRGSNYIDWVIGAHWLDEQGAQNSDIGVLGYQFSLPIFYSDSVPKNRKQAKSIAHTILRVGFGGYYFSPIKGKQLEVEEDAVLNDGSSETSVYSTGSNSVDDNGGFLYEFNPTEVFVAAQFKLGEKTMGLYSGAVQNSDANDLAQIIGLEYGDIYLKKPGDYKLKYNYRVVEKDAVLSILADSDFNGGQTDARGHKASFSMVPMGSTLFKLSYGFAQRGLDLDEDDRLNHSYTHADFIFRF